MESKEETDSRKLSNRFRNFLRHPVATLLGSAGIVHESYDKSDLDSDAGIIIPEWKWKQGIQPSVDFLTQYHIYKAELSVRTAVHFRAGQIAGVGFHTSCKEGSEDFKKKVDEYNEKIGLDRLLQRTAKQLVAFGNSNWWSKDKKFQKVIILPIFLIERAMTNEVGERGLTTETGVGAKLGLKMKTSYAKTIIPFDQLITFQINVEGIFFGSGIIEGLCLKLPVGEGEVRPAWYEIKGRSQKAANEILEYRAMSNELWNFPEATDAQTRAIGAKVKNLPRKGGRLTTNFEGASANTIVPERIRGLEAMLDNLMDEFYLGLMTPIPKLFTAPGFTEASATAAEEVSETMTNAIQREIKRMVEEELWPKVFNSNELQEAEIRLNWGMPDEPEVIIADWLHAWDIHAISTETLHKMLKEQAGWPLEAESAQNIDAQRLETQKALMKKTTPLVSPEKREEKLGHD